MPEKKKQHFVPQLLFRHFSTDESKKLIDLFNVDKYFYRQDCPIKTQGQEDYFYGEDKVIENELGRLEQVAAPIIKSIIETQIIPLRDTKEYGLLFFFSFLLAYRTKNSAEQLNEVVNKSLQEIVKLDERFKGIREEGIEFALKNAATQSLSIVSQGILGAYDLELKLIVNKTKASFITSDNPAIRYNQFLEKRNHIGGHLGMFTKGIQLFFPISPNLLLIYFDKWAYKIGNKKERVVICDNEKDIEQLNYLQVVNCNEIVYFNRTISEFYLTGLSKRATKLRTQDYTKLYEINKRFTDEEGHEHIQYTNHGDDRKFNLELSFINQPKTAKQHILSDYVVQLRDERMRKSRRP
jgi:hypothetical protein